MSGIFDALMGSIDPTAVQQISRQIGADPTKTSSAIQAALPLLLGAMQRNASQPGGAQSLNNALRKDHTDVDLGGLLGGLLGDGAAANAAPGAAILKHVLGDRQDRAAAGLGQTTGIGSASASSLMAMLAPLVMAKLGQMTQQQGGGTNALSQLLGQATQHADQKSGGASSSLLGAVLDRDGDGDVDFADLAPTGAALLGKLFGR